MFPVLRSFCLLAATALISAPLAADEPTGSDNWWWDDDWWEDGVMYADLENHKVAIERIEYERDGIGIPAMVARPADGEDYPAILWTHGRRGLDDLAELHVKRLARAASSCWRRTCTPAALWRVIRWTMTTSWKVT